MLDHLTLRESVQLAIATEQLGAGRYGRLVERFAADPAMAAAPPAYTPDI